MEGAEREEALELIPGQEKALVQKLIRAEQKLSRVGAGGEGAAELQTAVSEAMEAGITTEGSQGNGNQGNRGDIARAVEEALVSPEEVELARKAIAENNPQEWVDRASSGRK